MFANLYITIRIKYTFILYLIIIQSITEAELMHAYEEFVVPVFNADTQTITIVSPAAKVDETIREFKDQFGIELTKIESVDEL